MITYKKNKSTPKTLITVYLEGEKVGCIIANLTRDKFSYYQEGKATPTHTADNLEDMKQFLEKELK